MNGHRLERGCKKNGDGPLSKDDDGPSLWGRREGEGQAYCCRSVPVSIEDRAEIWARGMTDDTGLVDTTKLAHGVICL